LRTHQIARWKSTLPPNGARESDPLYAAPHLSSDHKPTIEEAVPKSVELVKLQTEKKDFVTDRTVSLLRFKSYYPENLDAADAGGGGAAGLVSRSVAVHLSLFKPLTLTAYIDAYFRSFLYRSYRNQVWTLTGTLRKAALLRAPVLVLDPIPTLTLTGAYNYSRTLAKES
jgi:hypothetical protein